MLFRVRGNPGHADHRTANNLSVPTVQGQLVDVHVVVVRQTHRHQSPYADINSATGSVRTAKGGFCLSGYAEPGRAERSLGYRLPWNRLSEA